MFVISRERQTVAIVRVRVGTKPCTKIQQKHCSMKVGRFETMWSLSLTSHFSFSCIDECNHGRLVNKRREHRIVALLFFPLSSIVLLEKLLLL
jgi:hypothetical protein